MTAHGLRWQGLVFPVLTGIVLVVLVWWGGPGMFGSMTQSAGTTTEATVVTPATCANSDAKESVQFTTGGQQHTGSLDACGHDKNDRVQITVPDGFGTGDASVHLADVVTGHGELRRPVGLALFALSCLGGGLYAFLVHRGPRRAETAIVTV